MANYSYNTSANEEAAITYAVSLENARRAAQTPPLPPLTNGQYILAILQAAFASYAQQRAANDISTLQTQYQAATPAKQAAALAAALAALA
jgi:hypothetical protein